MTSNLTRKPSFFGQQLAGHDEFRPTPFRVEEQLAGVEAGFMMDRHAAGIIGGDPVVKPEGVSEPGVRLGQKNNLTAAGMIEVDVGPFFLAKHLLHTGEGSQQIPHPGNVLGFAYIDMGQLMIHYGKGSGSVEIELFAKGTGADFQ
jgi:hypothetical protein